MSKFKRQILITICIILIGIAVIIFTHPKFPYFVNTWKNQRLTDEQIITKIKDMTEDEFEEYINGLFKSEGERVIKLKTSWDLTVYMIENPFPSSEELQQMINEVNNEPVVDSKENNLK